MAGRLRCAWCSHQRISPGSNLQWHPGLLAGGDLDEPCAQFAGGDIIKTQMPRPTPLPAFTIVFHRAAPAPAFGTNVHGGKRRRARGGDTDCAARAKHQVGGLILIFTLDKKAEDANLLRIARSGRLSALKVEVAGPQFPPQPSLTGAPYSVQHLHLHVRVGMLGFQTESGETGESGAKATLPVGAFRRSKRLCIVAGGDDVVR